MGSGTNRITYRQAGDDLGDLLAFCDLYNSFYAKKVDQNYVRWQFFETPFPSILCVAADETNKAIGFYGLHLIKTNMAALTTAWVLDIMISPAYQNCGVFRHLAQFAYKQLESFEPAGIFVMANELGANAHTRGLSWTQINTYVSVVADTEVPTNSEGDPQLSIVETQTLSNCIGDQLGTAFREREICVLRRDSDYFDWRYNRNPRFKYSQFKATKDGELFGYLVLKVFTDPVTSKTFGDIVDIGWRSDDSRGLRQMLLFALSYFHGQHVRTALMWLQSNSILDDVGRSVGFRRIEQSRFFCGVALDAKHKWLEQPQHWFLNLSASEIY